MYEGLQNGRLQNQKLYFVDQKPKGKENYSSKPCFLDLNPDIETLMLSINYHESKLLLLIGRAFNVPEKVLIKHLRRYNYFISTFLLFLILTDNSVAVKAFQVFFSPEAEASYNIIFLL